jgi:hypothetical protein
MDFVVFAGFFQGGWRKCGVFDGEFVVSLWWIDGKLR